jgi:hypothetical protein
VLHPEEAWPRKWFHGRWTLAALALALVLAVAAVVVGVVVAARGDAKSRSAPAPAPVVLPPESFEADPAGVAVTLTWSPATGGVEVDHYDIYRNANLLVTLSDAGSTYVDDEVRPGKEYTYEIEARGTVGAKEMTSERVSIVVTPPIPPLKRARVEGDFNVAVKTLSKSGYSTYEIRPYGWHFKAKCRTGTCDVVWADLHEKSMRAVLKQHGARYSGTYTGFFFSVCGGTRTTSSVKFDLKVAKAKAIDGQWQATKLVGRLNQSESAQLGCVSSRATQAVTATLVR